MEETYASIKQRFSCILWSEMLKDAITIKAWTHTFCGQWLKNHRAIIDECPICETQVQETMKVSDMCDIGTRIVYLMDMSKESTQALERINKEIEETREIEKLICGSMKPPKKEEENVAKKGKEIQPLLVDFMKTLLRYLGYII